MADRWFRLPRTGDGSGLDSYRPKHTDKNGVVGYAGNQVGNSPRYVARIYGDEATLDNIAAEAGVTELTPDKAAAAFNNGPHTASDFDGGNVLERFRVGE